MNEAGIGSYDWRGGREALLRFGPATGPVVIAALPLFEEANRTRAFVVTILRALAERGIAGLLPDVPGQGESLAALDGVTLADMQDAFAAATAAVAGPAFGLAIRSGALIELHAPLAARWRLTPQDGPTLVRELKRLRQAGGGQADAAWLDGDAPIDIAGNTIAPALLRAAQATTLAADARTRVVRLDSDAQPATRKIAGRPLWRAAEPDNDPALARILADDIADWVRTCAG